MTFQELTDEQWEYIKPHLPPQPRVGRKRANDRKTINGVLYVLVTGCTWNDMPKRYGSGVTAWRRLKRWSEDGTWKRIHNVILHTAYENGIVSLDVVSIDSTFIEAKNGGEFVAYNGHKKKRE
jgi:transposase